MSYFTDKNKYIYTQQRIVNSIKIETKQNHKGMNNSWTHSWTYNHTAVSLIINAYNSLNDIKTKYFYTASLINNTPPQTGR